MVRDAHLKSKPPGRPPCYLQSPCGRHAHAEIRDAADPSWDVRGESPRRAERVSKTPHASIIEHHGGFSACDVYFMASAKAPTKTTAKESNTAAGPGRVQLILSTATARAVTEPIGDRSPPADDSNARQEPTNNSSSTTTQSPPTAPSAVPSAHHEHTFHQSNHPVLIDLPHIRSSTYTPG
ncbi:hypothetical protein VF21_09412 [Pseudogymnoascus sp. 05NY08]|nr:hypothetical protein VF21_09412 [Pseudogymnoascus sp. 05NY08]